MKILLQQQITDFLKLTNNSSTVTYSWLHPLGHMLFLFETFAIWIRGITTQREALMLLYHCHRRLFYIEYRGRG